MRNLIVVLGDQLDMDSPLLAEADKAVDVVWMAETAAESRNVWSSKVRSAFFLSAMRHFRAELCAAGWTVRYRYLKETGGKSLGDLLAEDLRALQPNAVHATEPGEHRVEVMLKTTLKACAIPLNILSDDHFFCSKQDFMRHARGRKQLRMEYFYRELRAATGILMEDDGKPCGGEWNYDASNRATFGKQGPPPVPAPPFIEPDEITQAVLREVEAELPDHPGELQDFQWPVTRKQALDWLRHFIDKVLPLFGDYQDAMWQNEPFLFHSRLSAALNTKLLNPREVVAAAETAYHECRAPLNAVEGFIRQILGWREYVRGVYWLHMPDYLERNALAADGKLPEFYWTGETDYACLRAAIGQTLKHGYAHHIQRLMVTGLYTLLLGVAPKAVHEWYLAVYVDAVEWVELPNTLGMSQYADGGVMASKPYVATGKYIQRMSNYCSQCPYRPDQATGDRACPFTTLYWDFLMRHEAMLAKNPRMALQVRNLQRLPETEKDRIRYAARRLRG